MQNRVPSTCNPPSVNQLVVHLHTALLSRKKASIQHPTSLLLHSGQQPPPPPPVPWTPQLQALLEASAVVLGGPEAARPADVLQRMSIPGLSIEQVASHLPVPQRKGTPPALAGSPVGAAPTTAPLSPPPPAPAGNQPAGLSAVRLAPDGVAPITEPLPLPPPAPAAEPSQPLAPPQPQQAAGQAAARPVLVAMPLGPLLMAPAAHSGTPPAAAGEAPAPTGVAPRPAAAPTALLQTVMQQQRQLAAQNDELLARLARGGQLLLGGALAAIPAILSWSVLHTLWPAECSHHTATRRNTSCSWAPLLSAVVLERRCCAFEAGVHVLTM